MGSQACESFYVSATYPTKHQENLTFPSRLHILSMHQPSGFACNSQFSCCLLENIFVLLKNIFTFSAAWESRATNRIADVVCCFHSACTEKNERILRKAIWSHCEIEGKAINIRSWAHIQPSCSTKVWKRLDYPCCSQGKRKKQMCCVWESRELDLE